MISGELSELIEAIKTGRNHPLLKFWANQRRNRDRPSVTTTVFGQRSTCLNYVHVIANLGLSLKQARELVAIAANKSGAFENKITVDVLRYWQTKDREQIDARMLNYIYGNDPRKLLRNLIGSLILGAIEPSHWDYLILDD